MAQQIEVEHSALSPESCADGLHEVLPDVAYKRAAIVNCVFLGARAASKEHAQWILVDTGVPGFSGAIIEAAEQRFGKGTRPDAIVLTHAHFDHVGSLESLLDRWDVPVYAHELEFPYLTGRAAYPRPDPCVGGGLMALTSPLFPRGPIDIRRNLAALPLDSSVPAMPGWRWIHTPGHSPGHISLWRQSDRTLIVGDAFITTAQESAYAAARQKPEIHGPPMYYTINWSEAEISVDVLARLEPELVVTGHGRAMRGPELRSALHLLADTFDEVAVPYRGEYVLHPRDAFSGSAYEMKEGTRS